MYVDIISCQIYSNFCSTCNRLRITADGKLKVCLFDNSAEEMLEDQDLGEDDKQSLNLLKLLRNPMISDDDITRHISISVKGKQKELGK